FFSASSLASLYTLSLHDALPISVRCFFFWHGCAIKWIAVFVTRVVQVSGVHDVHLRPERREKQPSIQSERRIMWTEVRSNSLERSEEHTSELQSRENLVCRLLLE